MPTNFDSFRILDASLNRANEGLRVVEDYTRFVLDDQHLSGLLKQLRHDLAQAASLALDDDRHNARDTPGDVGAAISTAAESRRSDPWTVCAASCERTKQSLRSLEEYAKVVSAEAAALFESLRYRFYTIESAVVRTAQASDQLADVTLFALIDGRESGEAFTALVEQLVGAGVGAIQLRDKRLDDRELLGRAKTLVGLVRAPLESLATANDGNDVPPARRTLAIVNDRADIAVAAYADGVHVGQNDLRVADIRRVLGPHKLVGVSTHCIGQARKAVLAGANYLGAGPTFPSNTKDFDAFPGLDLLRQVAAEISLPVFAIGGIDQTNLSEVLETGINRIAVSQAITAANNVGSATTALARRLK